MYRKNVTYTDFNGNEVTDSLYFNLTEVELMEMQLRNGDMQEMLERLSKSKDMYQIVSTIKDIICSSYGERASTVSASSRVARSSTLSKPARRTACSSPSLCRTRMPRPSL